jgi:hypothetical protein
MSMNPVNPIRGYLGSLVEPQRASTALRVALVVGSVLFVINHGTALLEGEMTRQRWLAACLTYLVPYAVNIHGQYVAARRAARRPGAELRSWL